MGTLFDVSGVRIGVCELPISCSYSSEFTLCKLSTPAGNALTTFYITHIEKVNFDMFIL